ncbi:DUF445 domain-containing protein [Listeria floridensis]|uniref:DUF445 domain-containing protein n=1 Tax=Listeria floridensis TaxID=1494962 RepID=UPI0004B484CC|nr:DUF445 family protein [Listeria floridensis]
MNVFLSIILMALIGGFIGAMTNFIAIRMLFRPYQAIYIGKWRLPFTPGLIPKRRDELASKIGEVITGHLLTGDMIQTKLKDEGLQTGIVQTAQELFKEKMALETTPDELAELAGFENGKERLADWVSEKAASEAERFLAEKENEELKSIVPEALDAYLVKNVPDISEMGIDRASAYVKSEAGGNQIRVMLQTFF